MASHSAGRLGKRVLLLEKNSKLGVKILMSGGTRCNITHACDRRGIVEAFGKRGRFLNSALASLSPQAVIDLMEGCGVATKAESTGKVFPISNRALDVRDALVQMATEAGTKILIREPVADVVRTNQQFTVHTTTSELRAKSVLITTGGQSYPGCGTTGDGYRWARSFGHTIIEPVPALTPLLSTEEWALSLKGVTIDDVELKVVETSTNVDSPRDLTIGQSRGSFLFTHFGFSGPVALDISGAITRHPHRKALRLLCDWIPSIGREELRSQLKQFSQRAGRQPISSCLTPWLPKRLAEQVLVNAQIPLTTRSAELGKRQLSDLVLALKETCFSIPGTLGFEKAEVTAGGVCLDEIDSKTMQSKRVPGLYLAGEVLDLDGPIGGYNFQAAFSTGFLAGANA